MIQGCFVFVFLSLQHYVLAFKKNKKKTYTMKDSKIWFSPSFYDKDYFLSHVEQLCESSLFGKLESGGILSHTMEMMYFV